MGMDQYLLIPFLGNEHPFTSYFDVHQGYKVLTHPHIKIVLGYLIAESVGSAPAANKANLPKPLDPCQARLGMLRDGEKNLGIHRIHRIHGAGIYM